METGKQRIRKLGEKMIDHHMIKAVERGGNCVYCNETLESGKWQSEFTPGSHYKCVVCKCGKENCIKVSYIGTGHDSWSGLEKKVSSSVKIVESSIKILK